MLQDKTFNPDGTMFYPDDGLPPHEVWVPEFFGDTPVVNGKAYPFLNVEPRRYRFRIVNGSQARFYGLKFAGSGGTLLPFTVIGAEGGLLRAPVQVTKFVIAPGERVDIIVDFAALPRITQWVLKNDAKAPFPNGRGGEVNQLMRFNVNLPLNGTDTTTPGPDLVLPTLATLPPAVGLPREQMLDEQMDPFTGNPVVLHVEGQPYLDESTGLPGVSTIPNQGEVEDWLLVNTTGDTHPIHLHLVHFEVIDRRPFNVATYMAGGGLVYTGPAVPAPPWENGLKDTVQAHPGEVTRIRAQFNLPTYGPIRAPARSDTATVRVALPHPRARGERHDARLRGRDLVGTGLSGAGAPRAGSRSLLGARTRLPEKRLKRAGRRAATPLQIMSPMPETAGAPPARGRRRR